MRFTGSSVFFVPNDADLKCSNWQDYGGMDIYTNNAVNPGANHDLFYTDPKIATYYQNYVEAVVSRYNNSEAIFAWELANEVCRTKIPY